MTARFTRVVVDPGTATRTAKNVPAAPGLPHQPTQDSKGSTMVDTANQTATREQARAEWGESR